MAARKTTDLTPLTTPTVNTLVSAVDLTEALPANQNKKLTLSDLTKGLSAATTGAAGVVQLSTSTSSTSTTLAATPSAVKSAYDAATTPATTSAAGIVQLNDTVASTSTTLAATANAVKSAYDLANAALPKAGGTMTGVITYASTQPRLVQDTAKASTSGTVVEFTGIPSWVKRITVMMGGISTNGSSAYLIQIGSGSFTASGYTSYASVSGSFTSSTSGFLQTFNNAAASFHTGCAVVTSLTGNTWLSAGNIGRSSDNAVTANAGSVTISGTLDRIRVTTVNGTDTFDAGTINILYEG